MHLSYSVLKNDSIFSLILSHEYIFLKKSSLITAQKKVFVASFTLLKISIFLGDDIKKVHLATTKKVVDETTHRISSA